MAIRKKVTTEEEVVETPTEDTPKEEEINYTENIKTRP